MLFYFIHNTVQQVKTQDRLAQLDRAPDYESGGRRFESFIEHQLKSNCHEFVGSNRLFLTLRDQPQTGEML